jgi:hypothetical protein
MLAAALAGSVACSAINPYGIEATLYTLSSASGEINSYVGEMWSLLPVFGRPAVPAQTAIVLGAGVAAVLALLAWSIASGRRSGGKARLGDVAVALGMCALQILHARGVYLLPAVGVPSAALACDGASFLPHARESFMKAFYLMFCAALALAGVSSGWTGKGFMEVLAGDVRVARAAAAIAEDPSYSSSSRVYVDYESGGYPEFAYGMAVHADPRAELLCKEMNGVHDVLGELSDSFGADDASREAAARMIRRWDFDYVATLRNTGVANAIDDDEDGLGSEYEEIDSYPWEESGAEVEVAVYRRIE